MVWEIYLIVTKSHPGNYVRTLEEDFYSILKNEICLCNEDLTCSVRASSTVQETLATRGGSRGDHGAMAPPNRSISYSKQVPMILVVAPLSKQLYKETSQMEKNKFGHGPQSLALDLPLLATGNILREGREEL